jgi:uncharacterized protein (DUF1499 family)
MSATRFKPGLVVLSALLLGGCAGTPPSDPGPRDGRLAPCPDSPNCVSSQADDPDRRVAPLLYSGDAETAWQDLRVAIADLPRTRIVTSEEDYLHAEARSRLLGFVDDLVLLRDPSEPVIHVRSASRLGYYDFGVNRERVEQLRARFQQENDR